MKSKWIRPLQDLNENTWNMTHKKNASKKLMNSKQKWVLIEMKTGLVDRKNWEFKIQQWKNLSVNTLVSCFKEKMKGSNQANQLMETTYSNLNLALQQPLPILSV